MKSAGLVNSRASRMYFSPIKYMLETNGKRNGIRSKIFQERWIEETPMMTSPMHQLPPKKGEIFQRRAESKNSIIGMTRGKLR